MQKSRSHSPRDAKSILSGVGVGSIARNAAYVFGSRCLNIVIRFIYAIVVAHYLGPELYGFINYGISWYFTFLSFTGLGLAVILCREIGRDRSSSAWVSSLTFTLRISVAVIAAVACGIFGWIIESKPEVKILLMIFSIALVGRAIALWAEAVFTAYEVNKYTFRIQAIFRTFEVFAGTGLLLAGGGATAVAIVHAISWLFQALSGLAIARRRLVAIRLNWSWQGLKHTAFKGIPIGLGFILANWLQSGPLVLFRHMSSSENSLGQLALAMQAFAISSSIPMAAGIASLPVLSRSIARQDGKDLLYSGTMIRAALIFGTAAGLAGIGAGPWLVDLIFGSRYSEAGYLLGLVMWLLIPLTCGTTLSRVYLVRGQFFLPTACAGAGAVVLTLTMPWLVSAMDTLGAVLATGTGMGVWALSLIWIFARSGDLDVRRTVFRPLVVIIFGLGVFFVLKPVNPLLALLSSWTALLCGSVLFGVLTEDEWFLLASLKQKWLSSY